MTAEQLNRGVMFHGQRYPIWNQQRGIFRPALLREPGAALSIQTSYNSPYDDRWEPDDDRLSYRYRGENPNHPDNMAVRRAMELQRPLLYLVAVAPSLYEPIFPCYVAGDEPEQLTFFLIVDAVGAIAAGPGGPETWPLKAYVTRAVKQRLHQQRFHYSVLRAYRHQCAMCRLRHPPLLEAAHILPDRDPRGQPEVPNGLALCRIHHRAYDVNILGVTPDYKVHLRRDILEEQDGPMLRYGLQAMHDQRILLPSRRSEQPKREYLEERYARFLAA